MITGGTKSGDASRERLSEAISTLVCGIGAALTSQQSLASPATVSPGRSLRIDSQCGAGSQSLAMPESAAQSESGVGPATERATASKIGIPRTIPVQARTSTDGATAERRRLSLSNSVSSILQTRPARTGGPADCRSIRGFCCGETPSAFCKWGSYRATRKRGAQDIM